MKNVIKTISATILVALFLPATASAGWVFERTQDPISDETIEIAAFNMRNGLVGALCRNGDDPTNLRGVVYMSEYLTNGDFVKVLLRFDDGLVFEKRYFAKGKSFSVPNEDAVWFVNNLKSSSKLVVRSYTYDGDQVTNVFDLSGATVQLNKLSCMK